MAKNRDRNEYFDVAIPLTNTLLLGYLREVRENSNTPEGQILVQLATERVKQLTSDGQPGGLAGLGSLQTMMASMMSALPQQQGITPQMPGGGAITSAKPLTAVQSLGYDLLHSGAGDDDLDDAFGDPD